MLLHRLEVPSRPRIHGFGFPYSTLLSATPCGGSTNSLGRFWSGFFRLGLPSSWLYIEGHESCFSPQSGTAASSSEVLGTICPWSFGAVTSVSSVLEVMMELSS